MVARTAKAFDLSCLPDLAHVAKAYDRSRFKY